MSLHLMKADSLNKPVLKFAQKTVPDSTAEPQGNLYPTAYGHPYRKDMIDHGGGRQTKVTSLIGGGQIFNKIDAMLNQATESVLVDMYTLQSPELVPERSSSPGTPGADQQAQIINNLIKLANGPNKVKVKVILDNSKQDDGTLQNAEVIDHLRANGVEVLAYPDSAKISHVKLLVVDGKYAVIGGMNWGNHSPTNQDACVLLEGDAVDNLIDQIYKVDYEFSGGDVSTLPKTKPFQDDKIKILTTSPKESPDGGQNEIYEEILDRIEGAQKSIVAELFVLTDKLIGDKLIEAHRRLTKAGEEGVRILVDPGLYLKFPNCRPTIDRLRKEGVPIRFYKSNWAEEEKLHSKWAVFDYDQVLLGSANWSRVGLFSNGPTDKAGHSQDRLMRGNHEANVLIKSARICSAFLQQFNNDWDYKSMLEKTAGQLVKTIPQDLRVTLLGEGFANNGRRKTETKVGETKTGEPKIGLKNELEFSGRLQNRAGQNTKVTYLSEGRTLNAYA